MRSRPLLAWASLIIAAGGVFLFSRTVTILSLKSAAQGHSMHFKVEPSEQIALCYINSIYGAAVEERFQLRKGDIVLEAVRADSPAVMEYYGFEDSEPVQSVNRSLGPVFSILISLRQDQALRIGERLLDLHALGDPGDSIEIRVEDLSLASFLLFNKLFCRRSAGAFLKNP